MSDIFVLFSGSFPATLKPKVGGSPMRNWWYANNGESVGPVLEAT